MSDPLFKGASYYGTSTYGAWEISMKEIEARASRGIGSEAQAAENAITLYNIFAFLHHENIPQELFKNAAENYKKRDIIKEQELGLPMSVTMLEPKTLFLNESGEWDQIYFQAGIHVLLSFSLIRNSGKLHSVHPLVHYWSRNRMPQMEIDIQHLRTRALLACSVELNYDVDNYEYCRLLAPHIRANDNHAAQMNLKNGYNYYDDISTRFALVFDHIGNWNEVESLNLSMIEARAAKLGPKHPATLSSMAHLSSTYWNQGRWEQAEKLQLQVIEARKLKLGWQHPDTLTSMGDLASTYWKQGKLDEAEKLDVYVAEARKKSLGPQHPTTLISIANLASTYGKQRRWSEAETLEKQVFEVRKAKLGTDHPDTLMSMNNLASAFWHLERLDEAEKLLSTALEACKSKLGEEHPETLKSMMNLASIYRKKKKWDDAEKLGLHVLGASKAKLGPKHPSTLTSMDSLASTYERQGKWSEAESLLSQVVKLLEQSVGPQHLTTINFKNKLDDVQRKGAGKQTRKSK